MGTAAAASAAPQMDVPRATYFPNPTNPDGTPRGGVVGTEIPFDAAKMKKLYGTPANYVQRFNRRLDELVRQGWLLPAGCGRTCVPKRLSNAFDPTQPPGSASIDYRYPVRSLNEGT